MVPRCRLWNLRETRACCRWPVSGQEHSRGTSLPPTNTAKWSWCNDELKAKFCTSSPLFSFRDLVLPSNNLPKYIVHVERIAAMFGSAYCCEQLFAKMKYRKSRLRSQLSGSHLGDILLLSTSSIEPDIEALLHGKQH